MTRPHLLAAALITALLATACGPQYMQVPPDVAAATTVLTVTDRSRMKGSLVDEGFMLAPWAVKDVDRDWNSGSGFSVGGFSRSKVTTGYQFAMVRNGATLKATCGSVGRSMGVGGSGFSMSKDTHQIRCACDDGKVKSSLEVKSTGGGYKGMATIGGAAIQLTSLHEHANGTMTRDATGYRFDDEGPYAAAELTHPGRVFLRKGLAASDAAHATCLSVGLMLYSEPDTSNR